MRIALVLVALLTAWVPAGAHAALPPFELVQKSIAQVRQKQAKVRLDLRIAETDPKLIEWRLSGTFAYGDLPSRLERGGTAARLLWIAILAPDPIAEVQKRYGFVNAKVATVGVQDDFVYVYGKRPAVSVFRDLRRLAAFSVEADGMRWVVRIAWHESELSGIMVSRDGKSVLTARAASTGTPR